MKTKFTIGERVIVKINDNLSVKGTVKNINTKQTIIVVTSEKGYPMICEPSELSKININK